MGHKIGTCNDCKYWGVWYENACEKINIGTSYIPNDNNAGIYVEVDDDSNFEVHMITGPEFWCALFESRKE